MIKPPFRLHHLRLLDAVLGAKTLSDAARQLHVSQPAISKQLKQLQADLGFALFVRHGHQRVPTAEAVALVDQLRRVNLSLEVLNRMAVDLRAQRSGGLRVACIPSVATTLLPKALARLLRDHPKLTVSVQVASSLQVAELVETQQVELGVGLRLREVANADGALLLTLGMECLLPKAHPVLRKKALRAADLEGLPLITVGLSASAPSADDAAAEHGSWTQPRVRVDSSFTACRMAEAGIGIPVADTLTIASFAHRRLVRRRVLDSPRHEIHTFTARHRPSGLAVSELLDLLAEQARAVTAAER